MFRDLNCIKNLNISNKKLNFKKSISIPNFNFILNFFNLFNLNNNFSKIFLILILIFILF